MTELADVVSKLFKSQQEFMNKLIEEQRSWMQANGASTSSIASNIPPFHDYNKERSSWPTYIQQLEQHFAAYGVVSETQKRAYFLSWLGSNTYELLQKLFGSKQISEQTYVDLTKKLSEHFKSKVHVCTARYEFFKCRMKANQSYSDWIADLRGLSRDCQFVCSKDNCDTEYVDEMIRDIIILHTPHEAIRAAALQKHNASLDEVYTIAESYVATQKSIDLIKYGSEQTTSEVNQIRPSEPLVKQYARRRSSSKGRYQTNASSTLARSCSGCYSHHKRERCKFLNAVCRKCGKSGHISPVCLSGSSYKKQSNTNRGRDHSRARADHVHSLDVENILTVKEPTDGNKQILIDIVVNGKEMEFILDTGASASIIGISGYQQLNCPQYRPVSRNLNSYGANSVPILGETLVEVKFCGETYKLPLLVTNVSQGGNIFGLDWGRVFGLRIGFDKNSTILNMLDSSYKTDINTLCSKFSELFSTTLGLCKTFKARLHLKPNSRPKFFKARPIPFSQLEAFKQEAKRLEEAGIWRPIRFSEWAAPIVIVPKRDGKLRICGDFKVTINSQLEIDQHPLPRPEELFHKLAGGQHFSKIDMSDAYLQIELEEGSKEFTVVNTTLGLYQYQRLPFGIASAPAIYQRTLEGILAGISCAIYLDDVLVTGRDQQEHLNNLKLVFHRLSEHGLRVNRTKCVFFQPEVEYLGHIISASGVRPSEAGLQAIKNLPRPRNLKELNSFVGKINYYSKFINCFSQIAAPLNALRRKNTPFSWSINQEQAFQNLKKQIANATRLAHFRPELPIILATDASSHGIGAVISHINQDGSEQPIAFASKTLDTHQQRYSQIEKEALSIIYGVTKFHQYLYGRKFILFTDHKPLITLFHPDKKLPTMTANRLQRWAIVLMSYQYTIRYKPTNQHANADALSRLPIGPDIKFDRSDESCYEITLEHEQKVENFPVDIHQIVITTAADPILHQVLQYIRHGWPDKLPLTDSSLQPYFNRRLSLSLYNEIVLLETDYTRVVIPLKIQNKVLKMLHEGHWGVVRMKQLARRYCWWPHIDTDIELIAKTCKICQSVGSDPPKEFSKWPQPTKPWERVHIDYAGPFMDQMLLICIDALSKFPFVVPMKETTSSATIKALNKIFTLEGLPEVIVSDNGSQFTAIEFENFCKHHGIQHLRTAPFHPASNGEAERFVRTLKTCLRKMNEEQQNKEAALATCLTTFRATPDPLTGKSPAEILHGRQHRSILSQLVPDMNKPQVSSETAQHRKFQPQQLVYARNYARGARWIEAEVRSQIGSKIYLVHTNRGIWKRHQNQLKARLDNRSTHNFAEAQRLASTPSSRNQASICQKSPNKPDKCKMSTPLNPVLKSKSPEAEQQLTPRRSSRPRKPIVRFQAL